MTIILTAPIILAFLWGVYTALYIAFAVWAVRNDEWSAGLLLAPGVFLHLGLFSVVFA
mgnify:CR=1 FL=1